MQNEINGYQYPKPGGGYWNHINEMRDSYIGMQRSLSTLSGSLNNPNLPSTVRDNILVYYNDTLQYMSRIEQLFENVPGGINGY